MYSKTSKTSTMTSKVRQNRDNVGEYDPYKVKLMQDRLNPDEKERLQSLLQDIDDNLDQLMKEKAEYHKAALKSDSKSAMSRITRTTDANAFLYSENDQEKMADINERLQKYNPSLIGSQITNDHMSDASSVLNDNNKGGLTKNRLREFQQLNDDTRSMISMQSNLTGFSRKSGVSMLNMDSIVSSFGDFKKLPGEKGLQANAKRRMEKAQLAAIEANLRKLQSTEDLSYSERAPADHLSEISEQTDTTKIDSITLARLIEESREEQDQQSLMEVAASECNSLIGGQKSNTQIALYKQSELTMMQLARAEEATKPILEAQKVLKEIESDRLQYYEQIEWIKENANNDNNAMNKLREYNIKIK